MKKNLLVLMLSGVSLYSLAQTSHEVKGVVQDTSGLAVTGAGVRLASPQDTLRSITDAQGAFSFKDVSRSAQFTITITRIGYAIYSKRYLYNPNQSIILLAPITLRRQANLLNEVVVSGTSSVTIKEDTIEYRAADYALRENATTEDLLKKLPGLEVDKDGNVTAQGKEVTRVKVNGKDFFGGDVKTATQNLPADLIERIQIIDDYGDQANITGSRTGEAEQILNIQIRPDRNKGYFVNGNAGFGNEDRYQAQLNANYFNNTRQLSLLGNLNNTNASLFNVSGGQRGGSSRGSSFGGGEGSYGRRSRGSNFPGGSSFGGSDGLTDVASLGFNYRDQWSKKLVSYGSYSFFKRNNDVISSIIQETLYPGNSIILNNQNLNSNTIISNHRFNWSLEYKADSLNYIKFSPSINYSTTKTKNIEGLLQNQMQSSDLLNTLNQATLNNNSAATPNIGGNLLLNHRFLKRGRNISLNLSLNTNDIKNNQDANSRLLFYDNKGTLTRDSLQHQLLVTDNTSFNATSRFLYIEPIGLKSSLEMNWNYTHAKYNNNRETLGIDTAGVRNSISELSNIYNYSFRTNNFGLTYRVADKNYNYSIGLSGQPTLLAGESISRNLSTRRTGFKFVPVARFSYKFSRTKEFNLYYYGRNTEPGYSQIQPVSDRSNPQYPIIGNPDLNAEFTHTFNIRYNNFDFKTGKSLFTNITASFTQDKIVLNTLLVRNPDKTITQETRYLNANGYYTLRGFYAWSIPVSARKYTFSFIGAANYANNISYSNNIENSGKNTTLFQRLRLIVNPAEWIEFNPSVGYMFNKNTYSLTALNNNNNKITTWSLNAEGRFFFLKSMVLGVDFSKNYNNGYSGRVSSNPMILNTYLEKQFFKAKRGSLRLHGFDLFDENTSVSKTFTANSTIDNRSNRLGRYFMLSFTMRLQKFAGQQPDSMQYGPEMRRINNDRPGDGSRSKH